MAPDKKFWNSICGHNENFSAWKDHDFGPCFETVAVITPSHILLAIVSTYYVAQTKQNDSRMSNIRLPRSVVVRLVTAGVLLFLPLLQLILTVMVMQVQPSIAESFSIGTQSLTWLLHVVFVYRLKFMYWECYRGPLCAIICYLITFVSICLHVYSVIMMHLQNSMLHNQAEEYCVYVTLCCHLVYISTLLPEGNRFSNSEFLRHSLNISPSEVQPLSSASACAYGAINLTTETATAEDNATILSKITFHWVQPLMVRGYRKMISSVSDIFYLPSRLNTHELEHKFNNILKPAVVMNEHEESDCESAPLLGSNNSDHSPDNTPRVKFRTPKTNKKQQSVDITLLQALHKAYGIEYYLIGSLKLFADLAGFAGPILLNLLVSFIENKNESEQHGYLYALGLLISTFIGALCSSQFDYHCRNVGFKIRCAIITTVYRKALSVSSVSVTKFSTGQIVNFMSTDTDRIVNFCPSFHAMWSLPFQIVVSLYLLHQQVGLAFLAGLGFALILIPINRWLANKIGELSSRMMEQKDARVKMMNEVLFGMRIIKFYTWEDHFRTQIHSLREAELKSLKGRKYLDALCVYFWATTPVLISILTFTTYSLMGHRLTAAKVFTSLSLFLMLISPLNAFPWVINGLMEAWVSLKRVQKFVALKDLDLKKYYHIPEVFCSTERMISLDCCEFSWQDNPEEAKERTVEVPGTLKLENISFEIKQGQFIGIFGKVGSGKSSLLNALLAEMNRVGGSIYIRNLYGGFALASQESWIQHATIRDNILFGQTFSAKKYEAVLEAAAMMEDLKTFHAGDRTEVGENGVTLSGGQKARLALARAIYQNKDVYLLDDPLAAVDAHVAKHLHEKCIMGLLKNKTRILCTHHTKYLSEADLVIEMKDGRIANIGPPSEILVNIQRPKDKEIESDEDSADGQKDTDEEEEDKDGKLVGEEEKETGVVKLSVYKSYWRAVGNLLAPMVLGSLFLMQASRNINDWWLSYWVSHTPNTQNSSDQTKSSHFGQIYNNDRIQLTQNVYSGYWRNPEELITGSSNNTTLNQTSEDDIKFYLTVYGCLAGANSIFTLFRAFLFAYGGICAAQILHTHLMETVFKAPMSFFEMTPIGRILNRFSSDLYSIDDSLPFIMNIFLAQLFGILGTIIVTCYGLPWFALLLVPLGAVYYKIQQYYRHTSRELKRISSVSLSPIYAHFSETVSGLVTIRAFRQSDRFRRENIERLDVNQRAQFAAGAVASWLGFRLQMMGVIMVASIAFIAVLEHHFQTVNPGLVGLAISYALSVTNLLSGVVSSFTETEKQMVSVERAQQYIDNIPSERWEGTLFMTPGWPLQGVVSFCRVQLKYRTGLPDALNGVTFHTYSAEKLGIVGRTGSGKSSLFLALFRIVEISGGEINIDGQNIQHLDLTDVRCKLAIIPQDPFLFSGTVRENMDPTSSYSDAELLTVLNKCHLQSAVDRLGGLDSHVAERGRHFSVGQRQLLCLARALLKKAKVLCIDEATASVDLETDMLIQETIRKEFTDTTVLTIAHRINTIMDSDRILVMEHGQVAELNSPGILLQDTSSLFYKLVHGND